MFFTCQFVGYQLCRFLKLCFCAWVLYTYVGFLSVVFVQQCARRRQWRRRQEQSQVLCTQLLWLQRLVRCHRTHALELPRKRITRTTKNKNHTNHTNHNNFGGFEARPAVCRLASDTGPAAQQGADHRTRLRCSCAPDRSTTGVCGLGAFPFAADGRAAGGRR